MGMRGDLRHGIYTHDVSYGFGVQGHRGPHGDDFVVFLRDDDGGEGGEAFVEWDGEGDCW